MGQEEISNLLRQVYPDYVDYKQIMERIEISRRRVLKILAQMRKRDEIEFKMIMSETTKGKMWVRKYREKRTED